MAFASIAPSGIRAEDLNVLWEALINDFDSYYNSIPNTIVPSINAAVSSWQDFYYGNAGAWNLVETARWRDIYNKTSETLKSSIPLDAKSENKPVATAAVPKSESENVFYIQGNVRPTVDNSFVVPSSPIELNFSSAKWFIPLLVTLPGAYVVYKLLQTGK